ncbi:Gfo/Idh/MocA family protein [Xanthobacter wiegelii]|uniref:Gfo/Idh/MocA family protein n=1 Tax=Xanthobacter wiegelii TaxID=3119913 RepID=UPI00372C5CF3
MPKVCGPQPGPGFLALHVSAALGRSAARRLCPDLPPSVERIRTMLKVALIGLGKMGLSHQAIINAHPDVSLVAICDSAGYVLDVIQKYTGIKAYTDYKQMLKDEALDAVFIATPSRFHAEMVEACLDKNLHVFCEKPFCLDPRDGLRFAEIAEQKQLVNQVGYHYRFVGAFGEMKRLVDAGTIGTIHNVRAEAYGPVVLRSKGKSWRNNKSDGGGALYDYACHAIDLMNYIVGVPEKIGFSVLNKIFSDDVDDEVYSTFTYANGGSGQLSVNWSDESNRKMSTRISLWGTKGRMVADRQEVQVYLRDDATLPEGYRAGWNVHYTTELTESVWYYLRGEEYSAQIDHFVKAILEGRTGTRSTFRSATETDMVAAAILRATELPTVEVLPGNATAGPMGDKPDPQSASSGKGFWSRLRG